MKKTVLLIILLAMVVSGMAQRGNDLRKNRKEAVAVGFRLGGNLSRFTYHGCPELESLASDSLKNRIRPDIGIHVELPLAGVVYVAPELAFTGRGDSRLFESSVWDTLVRYQAKTNYLEFRLPVSFAFPVSKQIKPYVFVSPSCGLTMPVGTITQYSLDSLPLFEHTVAIDSNNMALYDVGVEVGAGMRFAMHFEAFSLVVKTEVGYYRGFKDTFSPMEHHDQAPVANVNAYNIHGKRKNSGFHASVTLSLPLRFYRDACFREPWTLRKLIFER